MGCTEKSTPIGVLNEDPGELHLAFGSSAKTSDFIVDCLYAWWGHQSPEERDGLELLQIKADNRPESGGGSVRTDPKLPKWDILIRPDCTV
jgi:hypothetical protein